MSIFTGNPAKAAPAGVSPSVGQPPSSTPLSAYAPALPNSTLKRFGIPLLLLLVIICFFWKVTLTSQFTWLENPDAANQFMPWQQAQAEAFHKGKLPLWDPYAWGGQSLIGQMVAGTAYPLDWVLYALPLRDGHIRIGFVHWYRVFLHWMAAVFAFWLCRELGRSNFASFLGGLAFSLAGEVGNTPWTQKLNGMIWIPLIVLYFLRATEGKSPRFNAALCGFFLGISWLGGHHQVPLYTTLMLTVLWVMALFREPKIWPQRLGNGVVCLVFFIFAGGLQLLPTWAYGHTVMRWIGLDGPVAWDEKVPFIVHSQYSLGLSYLFGLFIPTITKGVQPYAGPVLLSLSAIAIGCYWRLRQVRIFACIALAGILFALGGQNVLYGALYGLIPSLDKARSPELAVVFTAFGVSILAAYGFDAVRERVLSAWTLRVAQVVAIAGAIILAIALGVMMSRQLRFDYDDRIIGVAIVALLVSALLMAYAKGHLRARALGACGLGLMLFDLGNSTQYYYIHERDKTNAVYLRHLSAHRDIIDWLRSRPGPFRFGMNGADIPSSLGEWYGMDAYNGYVASLLAPTVKLGLNGYPSRMLYGTRYWLSKTPPDPNAHEVFTGTSGVKVYENAEALPRVWTVHQAELFSNDDQAVGRFFDPKFNARTTVMLVGAAPNLSQCEGADSASLLKSDFDTVSIDVNMQCAGMVILSDNYDADWKATLDGKPVAVRPAYTAIRGIEVGPGTHRIEMRYRPMMVYAGAGMFLISILGVLGLVWLERRAGRA